MSISSWHRFYDRPTIVFDYGITEYSRNLIQKRFRSVAIRTVPHYVFQNGITKSEQAFLIKAFLPQLVESDVFVFLDSDIFVVSHLFFESVVSIPSGSIGACPSAWDKDFTWTYSSRSLPFLRHLTALEDFDLRFPIPNSGVWYGTSSSITHKVSTLWYSQLSAALSSTKLRNTLNEGTSIGDQEFLGTSCKALGVQWYHLHGSVNMQVNEDRMNWGIDESGILVGGHFGEEPQPVKGIHYGCSNTYQISLSSTQMHSDEIRRKVIHEYEIILRTLRRIIMT
jgi:hypothetical protein